MKKIIFNLLAGVASSLVVSGAAMASSMSYYLDMSNKPSLVADNTDYLQVTIDDLGLANSKIYFTVTPLEPLTSIAGSRFGIDKFAFNGPKLVNSEIDLSGWSLRNKKNVSIFGDWYNRKNNVSIFGQFNNILSASHRNRSSSLTFSIDAGDDTVASYAAALSDGSAFFAVHVVGLDIGCRYQEGYNRHCGHFTRAYFGGNKLDNSVPPSAVPVPAAAWLFASGLIGMVAVSRRGRRRNT